MAASTTVQLILDAVNNASGNIKSVTNDLKSQKNEIKQLQAAEQARLAAQKAAFAQAKAFAAQGQFDADKTLRSQKAAALANQAAEAAANKAAIAQKKYQLALDSSADSGDKLKSSISGLDSGIGRLGSIAQSVIGGTIVAAFAAATAGVLGFAKGIQGAIDQEAKLVNMATTVMRIRSSDRESATGVVQNLDRELINRSGGIVDVNTSRQLARTFFDDALGVFDNVDATRITADLSNRLASIIGTEGSDPGQFTNVLTDFLSGSTSIDALRTRDVLNDTGINKILIPLLEAGGKEIKNLSVAERFRVLQQAIETALPDEALLAQARTTKGLLQAATNKLFGANGLFDVQRDLFPEDTQVQSVFETFKVTLQQLLGSNGIFAQLGRILKSSGFDLDPMLALNQGLTRFNAWLMSINEALAQIESVDTSSFGAALGQGFGGLINSIFSSIDGAAVGQQIATAVNGLASFITNALFTINWGEVGMTIWNGLNAFFANLSWETYLLAGAVVLGGVLLAAIGAGIAALGAGIVATIGAGTLAVLAAVALILTGLITLFQQNGAQFSASINQGWANLTAAAQNDWAMVQANASARIAEIGATISQAWTVISTIASEGTAQIGSTISSVFSWISSGFSNLGAQVQGLINNAIAAAQSALGAVPGLIQSLGSSIQGFINNAIATASSALGAVVGLIQSLGDTITSAINSAISTAQSVFGGISDLISSLGSSITSSIQGAISSAQNAIGNLIPGGETGASGVLPSAVTYASPTAPNTTNYSGGNISIESIVIQALPGMNESRLADAVIERLNQRVQSERLGYAN